MSTNDCSSHLISFTCLSNLNGEKSIILVKTVEDELLVLKMFPLIDNTPSILYQNESRAMKLSHKNIINIVGRRNEEDIERNGKFKKMSFVFMEYAPYGDISQIFKTTSLFADEKLARTYFKELIEGLEHMHSQNICHLDLKVQNLLIGTDFNLKITDFDLSCSSMDEESPIGCGTKNFRAPEIITKSCADYFKADIFSAGIVLFSLKTNGLIPYEEKAKEPVNFQELLFRNRSKFWDCHTYILQRGKQYFDKDFRTLFNMMTEQNPSKRASISDIKNSAWYNGPVYESFELPWIFQNNL